LRIRGWLFVAVAACALPVAAQGPASLGFSAERLARLDRGLQQYVDEERVAGAVVLVLRDGETVYERAVGWSDKEAGRRMTTDTIFRIASQSKAITSTAVLALVEEGKIGLNEPLHSDVCQDERCGAGRQRRRDRSRQASHHDP
jgi:CubicO group peptidase (beta-lactamase class C family)